MNLFSLDQMPEELRWLKQWCLAGPDEAGKLKAPYQPSGEPASPTDPKTWSTYEACLTKAAQFGWGVGFVLWEQDVYCVIDLDVKTPQTYPDKEDEWTTEEDFERYNAIVEHFPTYAERSQSGLGVHIWLRGKIGKGCKRDGVEIYSQERFIVCTGNYITNTKEICEGGVSLSNMVSQMRILQAAQQVELKELKPVYADEEIWNKLVNGGNSAKFLNLFHSTCSELVGKEKVLGTFAALGYKSQSEADLALMSMFTYYSDSNEQCRRLFRLSGLGKRQKAVKNDRHLDYMLTLIRSRMEQEERITKGAESMAEALIAKINAGIVTPAQSVAPVLPAPYTQPQAAQPVAVPNPPASEATMEWPPGLAGQIAYFIYRTSARPVVEIAITSALGLLAGICGKAWQIPGSGLNAYYVLVADSGVGKEALHGGISKIVHACQGAGAPEISQFVDFVDYKSASALNKAVLANSCFVNICGEWGRKLKRLSNEADERMQEIRTVMTNLYQKSAIDTIVGGVGYSNKEESVDSVHGIAYSMTGETTPETFYDALTQSMMEDGFLSRFTTVEYSGMRPELNMDTQSYQMPKQVMDVLVYLVKSANSLCGTPGAFLGVQYSQEALRLFCEFDKECDAAINGTREQAWRQMWNRAHLKVLRLASTLAVADCPAAPVVNEAHAQWALMLIRKDIKMFSRRMEGGDIGNDDYARRQKILKCTHEYMRTTPLPLSYKVPAGMQQAGIVPKKYLQLRIQKMHTFANHRLGMVNALESTLRNLIDTGNFREVDRQTLSEKYSYYGKAYLILDDN